MRGDYDFALVSNSTGTPTILATASLPNAVPNQPTQVHLVPGATTAGCASGWEVQAQVLAASWEGTPSPPTC